MTQTIFLGWNRPLLTSAVEWLKENRGTSNQGTSNQGTRNQRDDSIWDLSHLDIVLPSRRAIDRMLQLLDAAADESGRKLHPPWMRTVGDLPEQLIESDSMALDFEQTLAWARVLAATDPDDLGVLVATPPPADATAAWLDLGGTMRRLHTSIAAEALTFADVLAMAETPGEKRRWQFLTDCMKDYLVELDAAGKSDLNEAALDAIRLNKCRATRPVVLIGTTDMSKLLTKMLSQVKTPITSIVAAPPELANRFDWIGNLRSASWQQHVLPIDDEQLVPAAEISDQTAAVIEALSAFGTRYRIDQITVGVTDESQVAPIENRCELLNVETHRHLGHIVGQSAIGRLMHLLVTHLQRRTWRSLAALVRHADVAAFVCSRLPGEPEATRWLTQLDQLLANAFPRTVDATLPPEVPQSAVATQIHEIIERWLSPFGATEPPQSIRDWSGVMMTVLDELYGRSSDEKLAVEKPSTRTQHALRAVTRLLQRFGELSPELDPSVDGPTAVEMLAARMSELRWVEDRPPNQIDVLGWLDLALDDAPALVVCGLNHPFVPEAQSGDPFLPQSLRSSLHQSANDRRYARDVHTMQQLLTSREQVRFLVGSHSADGSPTPPSRLLAAATPDDAARRVCGLLTKPRSKIQILTAEDMPTPSVDVTTLFAPPAPEPGRTIDVLSVTGFSAYLACPYRFYLRHVLKLRPLDDSAMELAANQFGDLVHGALENFGESDAKDETDVKEIEEALIAELHAYAQKHFGDNTSTTVQLQIRQAQRRLRTVAIRQAERIAAGWFIHAVEASVDEKKIDSVTGQPKQPTGITVDGVFTGLRGRFDRIDHHPATGRWAILDYKTHGHKPEKKHLKKMADGSTRWVDLQLPLYRRFIPDLGIDADPSNVDLGYFNVAEKDTETQINAAEFTAAQFAEADDLITHCVRQIRACNFEPSDSGVEFDDYEMMMNESVFTPTDDADEFETAGDFA